MLLFFSVQGDWELIFFVFLRCYGVSVFSTEEDRLVVFVLYLFIFFFLGGGCLSLLSLFSFDMK